MQQQKYDFVDALRGIAILGVVMAHTSSVFSWRFIGAFGVQLFFVISAFTLFLSLQAKYQTERHPVVCFFIRRYFRIAPAFYLAACFYLVKDGLGPTFWAPDGVHLWQIAATLVFMHGWHPESINTVVPGGWSIAVEYTFYLFVPLLFILVKRSSSALLLAGMLFFTGLTIDSFFQPIVTAAYPDNDAALANYFIQLWFPTQACVFVCGIALFHFFRKTDPAHRPGKLVSIALIAVSTCAWFYLAQAKMSVTVLPFLFGITFVALCYSLAVNPLRMFVNPVICFIGKISFSLYLFHFWAISLVKKNLLPLFSFGNDYGLTIATFLLTLSLAALFATISFYLIEQPGQAVGRYIVGRIQSPKT